MTDPMGAAIADYWNRGTASRLRVQSPDFDEDVFPVDTLFRSYDQMPLVERTAIDRARGRVLDVGAGAGCHSLALQARGDVEVTAVEISRLSSDTMLARGVERVVCQDFFRLTQPAPAERYDTILLLMNGIGLAGTLDGVPRLLEQCDRLLAEGGQILVDSTDLRYLFEDEDGVAHIPDDLGHYYGEVTYRMIYRGIKGDPFPWVYVDSAKLTNAAERCGFTTELLAEGEDYDFLLRLTRADFQ